MKAININCQSFKDGRCLHQAAPRQLWGAACCILDSQRDPRINACALQTAWPKPHPPPFHKPPHEVPEPGRAPPAPNVNQELLDELQKLLRLYRQEVGLLDPNTDTTTTVHVHNVIAKAIAQQECSTKKGQP
jgi:hypothetical protein